MTNVVTEEIRSILFQYNDFNDAIIQVEKFLSKRERWRTRTKYFFNIVEIIELYGAWKILTKVPVS